MAYKEFAAGDVLTDTDLNTYLMKQSVIGCTSGTRPTLSDGMVIYETDTQKMLLQQGSNLRRVALDLETASGPVTDTETANDTVAALSYTALTNDHGVAFVAPPSGKVYVTIRCALGTNSVVSTSGAWFGFEVRTGSTLGGGSVVLAADDTRAAGPYRPFNAAVGFKYAPACTRELVTGLTAGSSYHARTMLKSETGATAAVLNRYILVEPVL